jgi:hypothetical protein
LVELLNDSPNPPIPEAGVDTSDEIWPLLAAISSYRLEGFCNWFRSWLPTLIESLHTFASDSEIPSEFILILLNVCDADLESRQILLHSSAPRFLSARLINSPVTLLSQLSLLLLHECLAVSPQIIVDFHPRQLFTWIIANETYAELAIEIACRVIANDANAQEEYLDKSVLGKLKTLLDEGSFRQKSLALRFLCNFMQICAMVPDDSFAVVFGFLPTLFDLRLSIDAPVNPEEIAMDSDEAQMGSGERLTVREIDISPSGAIDFLRDWYLRHLLSPEDILSLMPLSMRQECDSIWDELAAFFSQK